MASLAKAQEEEGGDDDKGLVAATFDGLCTSGYVVLENLLDDNAVSQFVEQIEAELKLNRKEGRTDKERTLDSISLVESSTWPKKGRRRTVVRLSQSRTAKRVLNETEPPTPAPLRSALHLARESAGRRWPRARVSIASSTASLAGERGTSTSTLREIRSGIGMLPSSFLKRRGKLWRRERRKTRRLGSNPALRAPPSSCRGERTLRSTVAGLLRPLPGLLSTEGGSGARSVVVFACM